MEWWGPSTRIEYIEKPDELLIRAYPIRRKSDILWPVAALVVGIAAIVFGWGWIPVVGSIFVAIGFYLSSSRDSINELLVTAKKLESRQGSLLDGDTVFSLAWTQIQRLEYQAGGEYGSTGLYAKRGFWSADCLIPNLTEDLTLEVIDAIYRKFPLVPTANQTDTALPFLKSTMIKLGLSDKR